jgi:diketogulonate reductase-like aldo/keto reductase
MTIHQHYILSNGIKIPSIGFGTWQIPNGKEAYDSTYIALKAGYRHIDTAAAYGNEASIGKAIKDSKIKRADIFITSKLRAEIKGYEIAKIEFQKTIDALGVDYLDLYLIHAPKPWHIQSSGVEYNDQNVQTWKAFIELYVQGKVRSIGVSNFRPEHLEPLITETGFIPHVNQIHLRPGALQQETVDYAKIHGILIEAYSPFATGNLFKNNEFINLAKKYKVTPGQLAIRWSLQHGFLPLPKSVTPERIINNIDVFSFEIAEDDVKKIDLTVIEY